MFKKVLYKKVAHFSTRRELLCGQEHLRKAPERQRKSQGQQRTATSCKRGCARTRSVKPNCYEEDVQKV